MPEGTDLGPSFFEARTGSGYEPEVGETDFKFLPTMYLQGACTPQYGAPSAAGAWKYWIAHGYFFASPTIWYWSYDGPNCGQSFFPPSGLSDVLDVGPSGAKLPYGFAIHGDSSFGRPQVETAVWLNDGRESRYLLGSVTK